ncbi:hypothetical protein V1525DRAFT_399623 [Lipomyces kononenkoae]|uniref:Uncharacterized protein n=1 Tax=Lipomyces kononenkoae TaxID=34357 RepID=A0ACC3T517_LIPKO
MTALVKMWISMRMTMDWLPLLWNYLSLKSNQTQKFKDSTFLALMRRLRDKKVVVQGSKMVQVVNNGEYAESYATGDGAMSSPFESAHKGLGLEGKFRTGAWEESC